MSEENLGLKVIYVFVISEFAVVLAVKGLYAYLDVHVGKNIINQLAVDEYTFSFYIIGSVIIEF